MIAQALSSVSSLRIIKSIKNVGNVMVKREGSESSRKVFLGFLTSSIAERYPDLVMLLAHSVLLDELHILSFINAASLYFSLAFIF
jgi:hypothetical protein